MRLFLPAALLAALLLAAPAHAQMDFGQPYQVRIGSGDIPSTAAHEPDGAWNVEQLLTVTLDGTAKALHFSLPAGSSLNAVQCTCATYTKQEQAGGVTVTLAANTTGNTATVRVTSTQPYAAAFALSLQAPPEASQGAAVVVYVPNGMALEFPGVPSTTLPSTSGAATIRAFTLAAGAVPSPLWATLHPATTVPTPNTPAGSGAGFPWLTAAVAFAAGLILWAVLVQQGLVQKRSRKQVAQVAAHVEAAAADPPAVLEGKKRALLAALKEVELARQNQEMDVPTYDAVKAEFKKQAVTVMRALDTSGDKAA